MRSRKLTKGHLFGRVLASMLVLLALFAVACGSSPAAEEQQTTTEATQPETARPEALAIPADPGRSGAGSLGSGTGSVRFPGARSGACFPAGQRGSGAHGSAPTYSGATPDGRVGQGTP